jgi:hypothetical protein
MGMSIALIVVIVVVVLAVAALLFTLPIPPGGRDLAGLADLG